MPNCIGLRSWAVALGLALAPGVAFGHHADIIPGDIPQGNIAVKLEVVVSGNGLTAPNWGISAPGLPDHLFVTDQDGELFALNLTDSTMSTFLDVSGIIVPLGVIPGVLDFDERGLIGVAFRPDFASSGKFYTYTSEPVDSAADFSTMPPGTSPNHQSVIREWTAIDPADPSDGVGPTSRELMRIDEPQFNHNSGALNFGPDGYLYIALGDGGGADDQPDADMQDFIGAPIIGHGQSGNAQNPGNILGNILRIDVEGTNSANGQYGVPDDNPFNPGGATVGGEDGCADRWCDEIWAFGLRNPFRFSFDTKTGLLFLADVGQNDIEEVDIIIRGGNYGWALKEGTWLFDHAGADSADGSISGFASKDSPNVPPGYIDPIAQYDHDEGVAVLGGFVYRGTGVGALRGRYIFADYAAHPFDPFAPDCNGRVFYLHKKFEGSNVADKVAANKLDGEMREFPGNIAAGYCLLGLGQDANGEVYVMGNLSGNPLGNEGVVFKIVRK